MVSSRSLSENPISRWPPPRSERRAGILAGEPVEIVRRPPPPFGHLLGSSRVVRFSLDELRAASDLFAERFQA
jgi:hypothetical protein